MIAAALTVSADLGPKPSLTITLENAPETYYLDLLVNYDGDYDNIYGEEEAGLDEKMFGILKDYNADGWYPALSHGTSTPLFGTVVPSEENVSKFSYWGLPDTYRIIVVTPDGSVRVSDVMKMSVYQESISFDYDTMTATEKPNVVLSYVLQFFSTFIPTLIIEVLLLFAFGISFKHNIIKVIVVNFATQLLLTAVLANTFLTSGYSFLTFIMFIPLEVGIVAVESLIYAFWLKTDKVRTRIFYALAANIASAVAGGFLLNIINNLIWVN